MINLDADYSDEFTVYGFVVCETHLNRQELIEDLKENNEGYYAERYSGTNEELCYESVDDLLDEIEIKEIKLIEKSSFLFVYSK